MGDLPWPQSAIVSAARSCVGARFRLHGRDPAFGFDCVGLAGFVYRDVGAQPDLPTGYTLRGGCLRTVRETLCASGFLEVAGEQASTGDLLIMRAGPRQIHLAIHSGCGFVHADLALRRVVETPGVPPWPLLGTWRWCPEPRRGEL